ncbi:uncharacterized protein isoform X3 [Danio rerio]|uniref:Uncharacterized protein isoform X3 n=1 Tax=Danio rerio TaxID=7955 RepID=A0AC58IT77_DANRE
MKMKMWALLLLLLLTHTSGAEDISTVSQVTVGQHQNITIPCVYAKQLVGFRKYVSTGDWWLFSRTVSDRRVCVVEHRAQRFFTVTLSDARSADSGRYWCAVEKYGPDLYAAFDITVTEGPSALRVSSQSVSVSEGSVVTLLCAGASQWCSVGGSCVEKQRGTLNTADVTLSRTAGVLNVTMKSLQSAHSGWYYCADQNTQIPVHITVKKRKNNTAGGDNNTEHSWSGEAVGSTAAVCVCVALLLLICGAVTLTRVRKHTRHTADSADPPKDTQQVLISSITEKRTNIKAESELYVCMSGVHLKHQGNAGNTQAANLYEVMSENNQENEHNTEHTSENPYELMSGIKQSRQNKQRVNMKIQHCTYTEHSGKNGKNEEFICG